MKYVAITILCESHGVERLSDDRGLDPERTKVAPLGSSAANKFPPALEPFGCTADDARTDAPALTVA